MPRVEAMTTRRGELVVTNEDLVRNAAAWWSPMTAAEIEEKTGIAERRYTELDLDDLALAAAETALHKARRRPEEMAAVLVCSCTSARTMPFNIQRVGNTSAASIGLALEDAVREGVIDRPLRVFTPAFGAGAVGGYAVMRVDPAVVG